MSLYTFESLNSYKKLRDKTVVVDTSYFLCLTNMSDFRHGPILSFHQRVKNINGKFIINVVARHEILGAIRKAQMIEAMVSLASRDYRIRHRYVNKANQKNRRDPKLIIRGNDPVTAIHLQSCYDDLFKEHLRAGDIGALISNWRGDIDRDLITQERGANIAYYVPQKNIPWNTLTDLMQNTALAPTDAMIANFAFATGATAIVTADLDFMQVSSVIDVFIPDYLVPKVPSIYDLVIE